MRVRDVNKMTRFILPFTKPSIRETTWSPNLKLILRVYRHGKNTLAPVYFILYIYSIRASTHE